VYHRELSHTQPPKYPFNGWGIKISLSFNHLQNSSCGHHRLLLVERFPTTVSFSKSEFGIKIYSHLKVWGLHCPKASLLPCGTHVDVHHAHHMTWRCHVINTTKHLLETRYHQALTPIYRDIGVSNLDPFYSSHNPTMLDFRTS
jgi:hypothetical protein